MILKNKTVIITGSSRGIGSSIAYLFAREGANLILNYRQDQNSANKLLKKLNKINHNIRLIKADVTKRSQVKKMFKKTIDHFKKIDILINNAGINSRCDFMDTTDHQWEKIMKTNLYGPFMTSQEVFPYMKKNGGRIINISSTASLYHGPKTVHYAVSKAGLNSLTKVLSRYGAKHNILINAIAPGLIETDQTRDEVKNGTSLNTYLDMTLLKKLGKSEEIAETALFLASDRQQYITGQVISVCGGSTI
jgi:3-oxoacyl-[acyl-carrier protein] reductase